MKSPLTGKEMSTVKEWQTMKFRKEEFRVLVHLYQCEDTGEKFEDEHFARLNYLQVVNQYRAKYAIPFPDEIIDLRNKYELSAAKMSEILGFGANTYRQYESGEVPSLANAKLIRLAGDPFEFRKLAGLTASLDEKAKEKLVRRIEKLIEEGKRRNFENQLERYFTGNLEAGPLTGFKKPDLRKFSEMVVFFAERLQPWKTKLNKLLFYTDFINFRESGFSISGMPYAAIDLGPVPKNFNSIFDFMAEKDVVDIFSTQFSDGTGEQFKPLPGRSFSKQVFTEEELKVLEDVAKRFKNTSTSEIIGISHKEQGWKENANEKGLIEYWYGFFIE